MALTSTVAFSSQVTSILVQQTDCDATMNQDVTGGTNLTMTTVEIDAKTNSLPAQQTAFVKFYATSSDTVGTTAPIMVLPVLGERPLCIKSQVAATRFHRPSMLPA